MNPQTRNLLIQRVIDSLGILAPGSIFERLGVVLVEHMHDYVGSHAMNARGNGCCFNASC